MTIHRSPRVIVQQTGPQTWDVRVPGLYATTAEGELERDMAITVASRIARRRYADAYPTDGRDWH